jgi:2-polyprenyl-3-methyl-5-hydroxy-6-metoxy-1,4-benzoquinol methylase
MKKDNLTELYDDLYTNGYHKTFGFTHSKNLIINGVLQYIKKGSSVIDIGCSNGTAMKLLQDYGYVASGVDISEKAIELAQKNGLDDCKVSKTHNIDYPDNKFNAILCTDVLEHVLEEDVDKTFIEFNRILKNNGHIFLKIALVEELNRNWDFITNKHGYSNLHVLTKNENYWFDIFKKNNLKAVKILSLTPFSLEIILKK